MKIRNTLAAAAVVAVVLAGASLSAAFACDKSDKTREAKAVAQTSAKAEDSKDGCAGKGCCKKKSSEMAKAKTMAAPAKADAGAAAGASK